jgi:FtsZ-binding cell division protein ZapB
MKRKALAIILLTIIALSIAAWFVHTQISELQTQIGVLQAQNSELQEQNSDLQGQNSELQDQNNGLQDQISELQNQKSSIQDKLRELLGVPSVKITAFSWEGGFNPYVGLLLAYPVNVTIQNKDVKPASGLVLSVKLVNKFTGAMIGMSGGTRIDSLNAGESQDISTMTFAGLNESLKDALCVVTLTFGNIVLDEWRHEI